MHLDLSNNMITHFTSKLLNLLYIYFWDLILENKYNALIALAFVELSIFKYASRTLDNVCSHTLILELIWSAAFQ